jgi:single-strand DNA-binding protein
MSSRSLNKVQLIGNLTRDPELRYTPTGAAVCTIGLATNRSWTTEAGEKKEETEFHRVVAWNKLAELCSQLLVKGRKIYVEGRLRTNAWQTTDGQPRSTTEIVIEDMIILDSRRPVPAAGDTGNVGAAGGTTAEAASVTEAAGPSSTAYAQPSPGKKTTKKEEIKKEVPSEEVNPDDIPF